MAQHRETTHERCDGTGDDGIEEDAWEEVEEEEYVVLRFPEAWSRVRDHTQPAGGLPQLLSGHHSLRIAQGTQRDASGVEVHLTTTGSAKVGLYQGRDIRGPRKRQTETTAPSLSTSSPARPNPTSSTTTTPPLLHRNTKRKKEAKAEEDDEDVLSTTLVFRGEWRPAPSSVVCVAFRPTPPTTTTSSTSTTHEKLVPGGSTNADPASSPSPSPMDEGDEAINTSPVLGKAHRAEVVGPTGPEQPRSSSAKRVYAPSIRPLLRPEVHSSTSLTADQQPTHAATTEVSCMVAPRRVALLQLHVKSTLITNDIVRESIHPH